MYKTLLKLLAIERTYYFLFGFPPVQDSGQQWCRIVMDQETEKAISNLPYHNFSVLEISGDKWKKFGFKDYKSVQYPDFDVCSQILPEKYDLIIAEQVFEHILRPYSAGKNVYEMLNPRGYFLVTTPFLLKVHPCPEDCTRWTETGMKYFLSECGFGEEQVTTGSWGNRACVVSNLNRWTKYNSKLHSLINEKDVPVVVWALAKK
ncbi:MAG: methyltransferase domain-containing protein [Bacteroidota bacterium]